MNIRSPRNLLAAVILGTIASPAWSAQFLYEGKLDEFSSPANGRYDVRMTPHDQKQQGKSLAAPIVFEDVEVVDGRFRLEFELPLVQADDAWVGLDVRSGDETGPFIPIEGRTKAVAGGLIGACWSTTGDSGSNPASNYLGTSDAQPLILRSNGIVGWRLTGFTDGSANVVGGGSQSTAPSVVAGANGAFIGGGGKIPAGFGGGVGEAHTVSDHNGVVVGGYGNVAGNQNGVPTDATQSGVVAGIFNFATAASSFIGGGDSNTASGGSSGVLAGSGNTARGANSAVVAGQNSCAGGELSFAGGRRAKVAAATGTQGAPSPCVVSSIPNDTNGHEGTFVWADATNADFVSSGPNQFLVRANGGVGINTAAISPNAELTLANRTPAQNVDIYMRDTANPRGINIATVPQGGTSNAFFLIAHHDGVNFIDRLIIDPSGALGITGQAFKPGGGPWAVSSDARLKSDVHPLSGSLERLLALEGVNYRYSQPDGKLLLAGVHTGFVAQQVAEIFPSWVGTDDKGYLSVAPQGFEALTVEALRELRGESAAIDGGQTARIKALEQENSALRERLLAIEARLQSLR